MPNPKTTEEIITQILKEWHIKRLVKNWNSELRKEYKEFILDAATTVSNEKNIKVEPISSTLKNDIMFLPQQLYCNK